ncbi:galactitol-1-phosphate 5-dehydrogenase [Budviciaceae bacterium CWB-B4]|uniref:Galactitol-1-phosphate 5-dehydrogenase n=2 Tax=Limnobaculum xujianqingii TaxID=2738837 RepID=A0A9D7FSD7_9GAMM|nr:galactitol-1-phosphate 5-dehydrogenase [Limnobaculum xujianqingii]MBK5175982.1 galactitol-1-phosphate 5-dehydrogenase [Limnobaculum xujianqingii]
MKAAVLHAPADLRVQDVPVPACADDEVLVQVKAAGICGSDLDRVMVTGTYRFPTIPGHEFSGVIAATGRKVTKFSPGDRVAVAPILPCFSCDFCQQGHYGQCNNYNYLGSRTDGGFAEYVAAPERNLVRLADNISYEHGAMVEPAAVTLHGVMRAGIKAGDSVAVLGCGALGLFAIQFARILGATRIIATDIAEDKLALAQQVGATQVINSKTDDAVKAILASGAVDVTIETAGVAVTQVQALEVTQKHGKVLYLGTAHADVTIPPQVFEHIIRNELTLLGAWNSFSAPFPGREWFAIIDYIQNGSLVMEPLITHTIKLEALPTFVKDMKKRVVSYNKVIIKM